MRGVKMLTIYRDNPYSYPSIEYDLFLRELISDNIRLWKRAYYEGTTAVEDTVYDLWWRNLLALERKHGVAEDSPTINPGYEVGG
jgi:NAD-dependent DNA ligase